jgi:hypothetical protein
MNIPLVTSRQIGAEKVQPLSARDIRPRGRPMTGGHHASRHTFADTEAVTEVIRRNFATDYTSKDFFMNAPRQSEKPSTLRPCTDCPHLAGCSRLGECLTTINARERSPNGNSRYMTQKQAAAVLDALQAGSTVAKITSGKRCKAVISSSKYRMHSQRYSDWAAKIEPLEERNRLAADFLKGSAKRDRTHCPRGHLMPTTSKFWNGRRYRHCTTCRKERDLLGVMPKPDVIKKVRALLLEKNSISSFTKGGRPGFLLSHRNLTHLRRARPEFDLLITETIKGSNFRAQAQRYAHQKFINGGPAVQSRYYREIVSMVPRFLRDHDDIVSNIFKALLDGSLRHDQIKARISLFVTEQNRIFPTKFAKFGNSPLVSLDEVLFEDGSTTRGDTVFQSLWD